MGDSTVVLIDRGGEIGPRRARHLAAPEGMPAQAVVGHAPVIITEIIGRDATHAFLSQFDKGFQSNKYSDPRLRLSGCL